MTNLRHVLLEKPEGNGNEARVLTGRSPQNELHVMCCKTKKPIPPRRMMAPAATKGPSRRRTITVTPLLGAGTHGGGARSCFIRLEQGGDRRPVRFLVDCGWDSQFKEASMARLTEAVLSKEDPLDFILLSFGDLEHVGALPLVVGRWARHTHSLNLTCLSCHSQFFRALLAAPG